MARQLAYVSGDSMPTNSYGNITILEYLGNSTYKVRFDNTGFETHTRSGNIRIGKVRDLLGPSVAGKGYIGVGPHKSSYKTDGITRRNPLHILWSSMINRCYDEKCLAYNPTYLGCTVCPVWLNFQTFCDSVVTLPGYTEWLAEKAGTSEIPYALDKDKLVTGNKMYSPETCCFITIAENIALSNQR